MTAFPFHESKLVQKSGLSASLFRAARKKMSRGVEWEVEKKATVYSVAGFYRVLDLLKIKKSALDLTDLQKSALKAAPEPPAGEQGVVERFFMNRLLLGVRIGNQLVKMRVARGRELYRRGDAVQLRQIGDSVLWEPLGPPPRRRR